MQNKPYADVEFLGRLMDDRFSLLGFNFGLNFIIDLIPGIGDAVTTGIALYILGRALQYKIPRATVAHMLGNIAIYFIVGLIPFLGDVFGVWWKPNRRNIILLQTALNNN